MLIARSYARGLAAFSLSLFAIDKLQLTRTLRLDKPRGLRFNAVLGPYFLESHFPPHGGTRMFYVKSHDEDDELPQYEEEEDDEVGDAGGAPDVIEEEIDEIVIGEEPEGETEEAEEPAAPRPAKKAAPKAKPKKAAKAKKAAPKAKAKAKAKKAKPAPKKKASKKKR